MLVHSLPPEIVPTLVPFIIRVRFIGLRQMHKRSYEKLKKARILITIGDGNIMSGVSKTTYENSANFPEGYETCSVVSRTTTKKIQEKCNNFSTIITAASRESKLLAFDDHQAFLFNKRKTDEINRQIHSKCIWIAK